jgi:hypothetical protein
VVLASLLLQSVMWMIAQEKREWGLTGDLWLEIPLEGGKPFYMSVFGTFIASSSSLAHVHALRFDYPLRCVCGCQVTSRRRDRRSLAAASCATKWDLARPSS